MKATNTAAHAAAEKINAICNDAAAEAYYFAAETGKYYVVDYSDLAALLEYSDEDGNAYSQWCADIAATEYDTAADARAAIGL